jgi:PAS domain S-box-containing protein
VCSSDLLIGKTKSELIGTHQRFLHPPAENDGKFTKTFEQHRNVKEGLVIETQVITKNGEIRDVAIKSNMIDVNGQIMMQGIFRDITESKKSLEKVRIQARLLDAVGQAIIAADGNGKITYWNGAAEQLYGWSAAEMLGRSIMRLINDIVQERNREVFNYLRSGKCWVGRLF